MYTEYIKLEVGVISVHLINLLNHLPYTLCMAHYLFHCSVVVASNLCPSPKLHSVSPQNKKHRFDMMIAIFVSSAYTVDLTYCMLGRERPTPCGCGSECNVALTCACVCSMACCLSVSVLANHPFIHFKFLAVLLINILSSLFPHSFSHIALPRGFCLRFKLI